jgi:hypothetical protein
VKESVLMTIGIEESIEESAVLLGCFVIVFALIWFDAFTNKRTVVLNGMTGTIVKGNAMNVNGASGK